MSYSAVYERPDGKIAADWIAYDGLGAALLGPASHPLVGKRLGYIIRADCGPPQLVGLSPTTTVDLRR